MPQRASVFCNFYIRVDREALVSERALNVGSVAFKAMSTKKGFRLPPLKCSGLVALSSPNELFACQLRIRKLYLGRVKPIFDFVNTELNNVSCLYKNEDDEESI
jgi:hypothetical protein